MISDVIGQAGDMREWGREDTFALGDEPIGQTKSPILDGARPQVPTL